jgi:hypothetical protein
MLWQNKEQIYTNSCPRWWLCVVPRAVLDYLHFTDQSTWCPILLSAQVEYQFLYWKSLAYTHL